MKTKEIEINGIKIILKELLYLDVVELGSITDRRENTKKLLMLSGLTEGQINNLTTSEGTLVQEEINTLNGFGDGEDFQKTSGSEKSK